MIEDVFYYNHNRFVNQIKIDRHQIRFHELTFLYEGYMVYYINDEKFEMHGGDIIYLPAGSMRQRMGDGTMCDYVSINFHSMDRLPFNHILHDNINDEVKILLQYLEKVYAGPAEKTAKKLVHATEALVLQISDNILSQSKPSVSSEIADYLSRHYSEKLTLDDISRETFFSVAYCECEFRKAFGKSIINYLIDLRISEAKRLLTETSMSCSVIANMVGFDDANYFSRVFKKRIGLSPLRYRGSAIDPNKS